MSDEAAVTVDASQTPEGGDAQDTPQQQADFNKSAVGDAAKEVMRKLKYKTDDGRDEEVDEAEALKVYRTRKQHQAAASRELNEGKALRKQAEQLLTLLQDDDSAEDILRKLGKDPRKLAEKILSRHLEDELMDPRERELRDAKLRLKHYDDMEAKQKQAVIEQRHEEMKQKYTKQYETEFVKALGDSGLPPTKPMVAEMAKYIHRSAKIGFEMTAAEAAQLVREDIQMSHQRLIGTADGDALIKLLGDDVANKVRKYDTSKLKDPSAFLKTPTEQSHEPRERKGATKKLSPREWRQFQRGLK